MPALDKNEECKVTKKEKVNKLMRNNPKSKDGKESDKKMEISKSTSTSTSTSTDTSTDKSIYDSIYNYYTSHLLIIWLLIIFLPISIITFGCIFYPELFYDKFIWPYFWGTIEADASDQAYGDVTEAYNPINTIVYAFIVIIVLYWTYKLFNKLKINIDEKFILAIVPFILIGGISRALEDAELFYAPTVYFFIAPIIYIFIGIVVITLILISAFIRKFAKKAGIYHTNIIIGAFFVILDIIYLIIYFVIPDQFSYILNPIIPVVISVIIFIILKRFFEQRRQIEVWALVGSLGLWFLSINIIILAQWRSIQSWNDAYSAVNPDTTVQLQPFAFILVLGLTCLAVVIVFCIIKILLPKYPKLQPFICGINLILFFGQFLDASATFVAIDYYGYVEKHVLPTFLIELFNTAAVMLILKAILVILVIYFIDILYKNDFKNNPTMVGLIKLAVLVLGLAPGIRDVLRLTIGV